MSEILDVMAVVGSLRRDSFNRRLAEALAAIAPQTLRIEVIHLGELPLYNQDDEQAPARVTALFRDRVRRADAVLFVTPEYNRSIPGALKNAIDIGSRPYGQNVWAGKPAAVISATPGALGAFGANHHLRQTLVAVNMPTMPQPEAYISGVDKVLDDSGRFVVPATREFFSGFLGSFEAWVRRLTTVDTRTAADQG